MGNLRSLFTRRRRGSERAVYIAIFVSGLFVGMGAWGMSHPASPVTPMVTFGTAADTPAPTPSRTGFTLTP